MSELGFMTLSATEAILSLPFPPSQSAGVTMDNHAGPFSAYVAGSPPSKMCKLHDISDSENSDSAKD